MKKYNFYAGPAILPAGVLEQAAEAVGNFRGTGLSVLEISHRSKEFIEVMDRAKILVRDLLDLEDDHEVMFLGGGASTQFFTLVMNLLDPADSAAYVDTGSWSSKAIKEAKGLANIEVIASSKDRNYSYIPRDPVVPANAKYLHITSNNTIYGTRYSTFPDVDIPLVCDMSSDIFSRPIEAKRFGLIYAGAQKNLGPAGVTLVIARKSLLGKLERYLPSMVDYRTHIEKGSMFNTPPAFPVYVSMLTLEWLVQEGGLAEMERRNTEKAGRLYAEIDRNPLFRGTAELEDRSLMNVCFLLNDERLEDGFLETCDNAGIVGIKGHRSVGGFRASIYNAMPVEGVERLVEVMADLSQKYA